MTYIDPIQATASALVQARHDIARAADRAANRRLADPCPPEGSLHAGLVHMGQRRARRTDMRAI